MVILDKMLNDMKNKMGECSVLLKQAISLHIYLCSYPNDSLDSPR